MAPGPCLVAGEVSLDRKHPQKVVATVSRREGVYNRAGEPSMPFCGKGGARERADDVFFALGIKRRRSKADFAPAWCR